MMILNCAYKENRSLIILHLGERNNKLCGIVSESFNALERQRVIGSKDSIDKLSLDLKITWFRTHCPFAYKNGYREIHTHNLTIVSKHNL